MKINEIELLNVQPVSKKTVEHYLTLSSPRGMMDEFVLYYLESDNQRMIILVDQKEVAAFASFITRLNGRVWQARGAGSFALYKGKNLVGKIYQLIKTKYKQSIQSDNAQSYGGMRIWTKTLPSLGMFPMIFDTKTDHIIDPKQYPNIKVYPESPTPDDPDMNRYCWILEKTINIVMPIY
jgi:hypothetical protein